MKSCILFCLPLFLLAGCQEPGMLPLNEEQVSAACQISNPLRELEWLQETIQSADPTDTEGCAPSSVIQGTYRGETVFLIPLGGALCCTCGNAVYNCQGEAVIVCDFGEEAKIKDKKIIWKLK